MLEYLVIPLRLKVAYCEHLLVIGVRKHILASLLFPQKVSENAEPK